MADNYRYNNDFRDNNRYRNRDDRDLMDRAGDEMRSWFGDDDAERRRMDQRYNRDYDDYGRDRDVERSGRSYDRDYDRGDQGYGRDRDRSRSGDRGEYRNELTFERGYGAYDASRDRGYRDYDDYDRDIERGRRQYGRGNRDRDYDDYGGGRDRSRYDNQGYDDQGYRNQDYGSQRYGSQSQGRSGSQDYSYSYTEVWLIPGEHTGRGPEGYQRSQDSIKEEVNERLTRHGQLNPNNVQVEVDDNGEVTLNGTVSSRRDKRMAEDAIETVSGVRDVHNRLARGEPGLEPGHAQRFKPG